MFNECYFCPGGVEEVTALALAHPLLLRPACLVLLPLQEGYLGLEADVLLIDLVEGVLELQRLVIKLFLVLLYLLGEEAGEVVAGCDRVEHMLFGDFSEVTRLLIKGNAIVIDCLCKVVADLFGGLRSTYRKDLPLHAGYIYLINLQIEL